MLIGLTTEESAFAQDVTRTRINGDRPSLPVVICD